jgi:hypothetical protein
MTTTAIPLPQRIRNTERFELNRSSWQAAGLVGWWPLGAYPDARNMSVYGSARPNATFSGPVPGAAGQRRGLFFDGTNDYLVIPNYPQINDLANITIQCWVINATDSWTNPVSKDGNNGYYLQLNASAHWVYGTVYIKYGSASAYFDAGGTYAADTWYMYTMVFNDHDGDGNGTLSVYRDGGTLAMSGTGGNDKAGPTGQDDDLFIGQFSSDGSGAPSGWNYYLDGLLDDVRIYNRALSANEVAAIYNQTRDGGYGDLAARPASFHYHALPAGGAVPYQFYYQQGAEDV